MDDPELGIDLLLLPILELLVHVTKTHSISTHVRMSKSSDL